MSKNIGEITVKFDDDTEKKFNVRRRKYSEEARVQQMLRSLATIKKNDKTEIDPDKLNVEEWAKTQIEVCRTSLGDAEGKIYLTPDEIDDWGGGNVQKVCDELTKFYGPPKTSVDHSGN